MPNYQHVLVAVDFSKDNKMIVERAMEIAQRNTAKLTLLHVVEYASIAYSGDLIMPEEVMVDKELMQQAENQLRELKDTLDLPRVGTAVEIGSPKHEIVRVAEEREADLIVIGSHGRHGFQLLLGSTANGVLHLAKCDVLAVRVSE